MATFGLTFCLTQHQISISDGGFMGQIIFILLVLGGLGYFFYRQMSAVKTPSDSGWALEDKPDSGLGPEAAADAEVEKGIDSVAPDSLDARIIALVTRTPGILQTEVYAQFPDENRKSLQAVLLQMDRDGTLSREREGSSYRLFVA